MGTYGTGPYRPECERMNMNRILKIDLGKGDIVAQFEARQCDMT